MQLCFDEGKHGGQRKDERMNRERAYVKNEGTREAPYFVEVHREYSGVSSGDIRFTQRDHADRAAAAINKMYEKEGRLWDGVREEWDR